MACGFGVDFCAHIGYSFRNSAGSGDERAAHAIVHSGRAIINAGFTTLISCAAMFAGGPIFTTFAKMFLGYVFA
jgi:predicted RND superfamily exporter protein